MHRQEKEYSATVPEKYSRGYSGVCNFCGKEISSFEERFIGKCFECESMTKNAGKIKRRYFVRRGT